MAHPENPPLEEPLLATGQKAKKPKQLIDWMRARQVDYKLHHHPPLRTVEEAERLRGDLGGTYVKNLFLRDRKKNFFLLICLSSRVIDLQWLRRRWGCPRLSFASREALWSHLGVRPGSVSPLALINAEPKALTFYADEALLRGELTNLHPLSNEMTAQLSPDAWVSAVTGWGFTPRWIQFDENVLKKDETHE
jgi:Ala-tRNA(Pro) deacylase